MDESREQWTVDYEAVWPTLKQIGEDDELVFGGVVLAMQALPETWTAGTPMPDEPEVRVIILGGLLAQIEVIEDEHTIILRHLTYMG
ncbi:hypothetical protein ABT236_38770 [Streptomyces sp. NPDC001523]|uniref:hypothetical protein n=1 Tax=Streptomyces sp. NPDC001523 TaxID=3154383 RepID=UPI00332D3C71